MSKFNRISLGIILILVGIIFISVISNSTTLSIANPKISYGTWTVISANSTNPANVTEIAVNGKVVSESLIHGIPDYYTFYGFGSGVCNQTISAGNYNIVSFTVSPNQSAKICSNLPSSAVGENASTLNVLKAKTNLNLYVNKTYNASVGESFLFNSSSKLNILPLVISINGRSVNTTYINAPLKVITPSSGFTINNKTYDINGTLNLALSSNGKDLYAVNYYNTVSEVNLSSGKVVGILTGFYGPSSMAIINNSYAYVTNAYGNNVSLVNLVSGSIVKNITGFDYPEDVVIAPGNRYAYVTNLMNNTISKISISSNKVVGGISGIFNGPYDIAFSSQGYMFVTNYYIGIVQVVNTTSGKSITNFPTNFKLPEGIAIAPDGLIYVANANLSESNVESYSVQSIPNYLSIMYEPDPQGIVIPSNGTVMYVSNRNSTISVFNIGNYSYNALLKPGNYTIELSSPGNANYTSAKVFSNFTVTGKLVNVTNTTAPTRPPSKPLPLEDLYIVVAIIVIIIIIAIIAVAAKKRNP
ncbi:DNA-binding beta-propeller fold protein YncE [Candidatus Mancarchaeum acidiphilum]|uniref:DNA-binding beta-propeller fold protein YncE n=1 Tax=Candidatus Mancarchaeum acidiphilum TaxID=1920749 RepID=A0A218NMY8_9ARCH|nr:DNA-binding beta-propeller fold protein YncE [Candidatus Mancarchaeum acidiphilum]